MHFKFPPYWFSATVVLMAHFIALEASSLDLNRARVLAPQQDEAIAQTAATVLSEEIASRTGLHLETVGTLPGEGTTILLAVWQEGNIAGLAVPTATASHPVHRAEGYWLHVDEADGRPVLWVLGHDGRGVLFGVGALLRKMAWEKGAASLPDDFDLASAPAYPIRGHQLGYRARANSWDAWTLDQFDQHIRELTFFGLNSFENIPFQDETSNSMMKYSREEMNRELSRICDRYDVDYWVWTPAEFDLSDQTQRDELLAMHKKLYADSVRIDGVFFPGGDPGDNPPELVMPFLADVAKELSQYHPHAKVWLSLQGFHGDAVQKAYDYIKQNQPEWLGGLVDGPSGPPTDEQRLNLPAQYKLRMYPDITHNKLSQYVVPWWDNAFALTLGREAINPRPAQYTQIHNWYAPYSDGFISYSDGVHDDVNKAIFSALAWDPSTDPRTILEDYSRVFFGPKVAAKATDGIFALEKNWQGSLAENGAVDGTLLLWQQLEKEAPQLADNWRWQMNLMREYYDAYTRKRLLRESALELDANRALLKAPEIGADAAMGEALKILGVVDEQNVAPELLSRIEALCDDLFKSIQLQTSVEKYGAAGAERGASLDFVNYPLNNRWWLEDEFKKVSEMKSETEKVARLRTIATWESPGPGSFYDDIGNIAKMPHVQRAQSLATDPIGAKSPYPTWWWLDNGLSRLRLAWQVTMDFPEAVIYAGLDPNGTYKVRLTGYGQMLLKIDGERVEGDKKKIVHGDFVEFDVPKKAIEDRRIELTWDRPTDEALLNWRQQSRVAEAWLLKQ